jgi:hypothetical protein
MFKNEVVFTFHELCFRHFIFIQVVIYFSDYKKYQRHNLSLLRHLSKQLAERETKPLRSLYIPPHTSLILVMSKFFFLKLISLNLKGNKHNI